MKKTIFPSMKYISLAVLITTSACTSSVCADAGNAVDTSSEASMTTDEYKMEANLPYDVDLDGDGISEQLSFLSYTNEGVDDEDLYYSNAVLDFFIDGDPFWSITDEDWSYYWKVCRFEPGNGKTYLMASSVADSDWTNQVLILTMTPDSTDLQVLADLTALTRDSDTITENLLGAWARAVGVAAADENAFTVDWMLSSMCTGNISVSITYTIDETGISVQNGPVPLSEVKEWTSWRDFDVQVSPEDAAAAFHVSPDEKVTLTELVSYNDHYYLRCVNSSGEEGWIYDPDEIYSEMPEGSDMYLMGYFKEALFAG